MSPPSGSERLFYRYVSARPRSGICLPWMQGPRVTSTVGSQSFLLATIPAVHDLGAAKRGTCVLGIFQEAGFAARASGPCAANLALSPSSTAPGPWLNGSRLPSQGRCATALGPRLKGRETRLTGRPELGLGLPHRLPLPDLSL